MQTCYLKVGLDRCTFTFGSCVDAYSFDLVGSNKDRVKLMCLLVGVWKRLQQRAEERRRRWQQTEERRRHAEERKQRGRTVSTHQTRTPQVSRDPNAVPVSAAQRILHKHTHKRLKASTPRTHRPSPLVEVSGNTGAVTSSSPDHKDARSTNKASDSTYVETSTG